MDSAAAREEDRTARARIRDAAIARFAAHGAAATVKAIAADAGVSPALVFHHFGSKDGLRAACDAYVLAVVDEQKQRALAVGPQLDVFAALQQDAAGPPVLDYLALMLTDGSAAAAALIDGMVDVGVGALEAGVRSGLFKPMDNPRDLGVVLTLWSLGLLVLRDHAKRLLDVDLTGAGEERGRYVLVAMEALQGLLTDEANEQVRRNRPPTATRQGSNDDRA